MAIGKPGDGMGREDPGREYDMMDIREILCAKDAKGSYPLFLQLEQQAGEDPALFQEYRLYLEMLKSESSYHRVRGFRMLCAGAKWDTQGVIHGNLPQILAQLEDKKPTAVRQCLAALPALVKGRPELTAQVCEVVAALDFSGCRDTMRPLLEKDREAFLEEYER